MIPRHLQVLRIGEVDCGVGPHIYLYSGCSFCPAGRNQRHIQKGYALKAGGEVGFRMNPENARAALRVVASYPIKLYPVEIRDSAASQRIRLISVRSIPEKVHHDIEVAADLKIRRRVIAYFGIRGDIHCISAGEGVASSGSEVDLELSVSSRGGV